MQLPDYSFLLSVYDKENPSFLDECLKSIFLQSHLSNNIVLVIDGPINNQLEEVIRKYRCKELMVVKIEKNVGLGDALKTGLEKCKNNIVLRMDTDDICKYDRAEKQVEFLVNNPDVSVVGTPVYEFENDTKNIVSKKNVPISNNEVKRYSKFRNPICHPTVAYRKNDILSVGNYERVLLFEDYYLWLKMISRNFIIENIDEPLVWMRVSPSLYKRRGGISYIKKHYKFRKREKELGLISMREFLGIVIVQGFVAIIPNDLRSLFYQKVLRKNDV